ncbi:MAG TPA: transporter substrate-binding domain-containing protein, partial [Caulobacteraceae bacterium]|jgi:general L-amino acid transport system substrate-binding protein
LTTSQRLAALRSGQVDVLWRNTSHTLTRDAGLEFAGTNYYDGQGFLVRRTLNLGSATELNGARICVQAGSTTQQNLADYFGSRGLRFEAVVVDSEEQARSTYNRELCDAFSADVSALAAARTTLATPAAHVILSEVISREPLGPVVREGDDQWEDVVRWTLNALILAEELGVTAENAEEMLAESRNPEVRRLLGAEGGLGAPLGLRDDWAFRAVQAGGNYGEIFARHLGPRSPLKLERGLNALWTAERPGLMYASPVR